MLVNWVEHTRRIYTDGRDWPTDLEPTLTRYSIATFRPSTWPVSFRPLEKWDQRIER